MKKFISLLTLMILLLVMTTCKKDKKEDKTIDPITPVTIIPATTKVISESDWNANIISIDTINYTFTYKSDINNKVNLKVGDIMVSAADGGYLRKVKNIITQNNQTIVETEFASICDAIEECKVTFTANPEQLKVDKIDILKDGVTIDTLNKKANSSQFKLNTNFIFYDKDGDKNTTNDQVRINGSVELITSLKIDLEIKKFNIQKLDIKYIISDKIAFQSYSTFMSYNIFKYETPIASIGFTPLVFFIGPAPVVITPVLVFNLGTNISLNMPLKLDISTNADYTIGIKYENNEWVSYKNVNKVFNPMNPTFTGNVDAEVYVKPEYKFKVYGTISPKLYAKFLAEILAEADPINSELSWDVYAGIQLGAGIDMKIFKKDILNYEINLFDVKERLAGSSISANRQPEKPSEPSPANNAMNQSITSTLSWNCNDPESDPLTYDIYFGTTTNLSSPVKSGNTTTTYNPGILENNKIYYWKIVAKDDHSNSTVGDVWNFTTVNNTSNQAPDKPYNPNPTNNATNQSISTSISWQCSDPESDPMTYDVYFGTTINLSTPVKTGNTSTTYNPGTLENNKIYYWKIVAKDDHNNTTVGDVWNFTTGSSGSGGEPCPGLASFTDTRDGQVYNTVQIGTQCWMKENLNVGTMINGTSAQTNNSVIEKYCYNNDPANCTVYGGLYQWDEMMHYVTTEITRGICPTGWHIPNYGEWQIIVDHFGGGWAGYQMKEEGTKHWLWPNNGTNESGFTALPGGLHYTSGEFTSLGYTGYWLSATLISSTKVWVCDLGYNSSIVNIFSGSRVNSISVRCIKD